MRETFLIIACMFSWRLAILEAINLSAAAISLLDFTKLLTKFGHIQEHLLYSFLVNIQPSSVLYIEKGFTNWQE